MLIYGCTMQPVGGAFKHPENGTNESVPYTEICIFLVRICFGVVCEIHRSKIKPSVLLSPQNDNIENGFFGTTKAIALFRNDKRRAFFSEWQQREWFSQDDNRKSGFPGMTI